MSVYVDPMFNHGGSETFRWKRSCHMYADTLEELHVMADLIGMKRSWFQDSPSLQHYDLVESRRIVAVKNGAVEHDRRQSVEKWRELRRIRIELIQRQRTDE